ncbi:hypothetical protein RRG08_010374 [Elysia crispata]|uniref:Uncharacterized protein n=1 Tax=Elysia crispata TaxID=231223 RepID=A0AAE1EE40_9GAST|nr:hypothetical protein RRG08_010374 [Elysia crispata]
MSIDARRKSIVSITLGLGQGDWVPSQGLAKSSIRSGRPGKRVEVTVIISPDLGFGWRYLRSRPETKTALGYAANEIRRGVIVLARNRNFPKEKGTSCAPYIPGIAGSSEKIRIARENDTYKYTQDSSAVSADLARGVACVYSTPGLGIFLKVGGIPLR